jgi:hypothetical protein
MRSDLCVDIAWQVGLGGHVAMQHHVNLSLICVHLAKKIYLCCPPMAYKHANSMELNLKHTFVFFLEQLLIIITEQKYFEVEIQICHQHCGCQWPYAST